MNKTKLTIDEIADINPEAMLADGFDGRNFRNVHSVWSGTYCSL